MDTDSDSDSEFIPATPPPSSSPPTPSSKQPPQQPKSKQPSPPPLSSTKFRIFSSSSSSSSCLFKSSFETLPAGYFSKPLRTFAPFPEKSSLDLENDEITDTEVPARTAVPKRVSTLNLVGAADPSPPVKFKCLATDGSGAKCNGIGNGNFVKLNLTRNKRKFGKKSQWKRSKYPKFSKGRGSHRGSRFNDSEGFVNEFVEVGEGFHDAVRAVRNEASDENLLRLLNVMCGYDSFRDGQMEAIKNVLYGKSTMLVLPTGGGKSLCYQIPAVVLTGVTLVVSPLVSLMCDQLNQLPHGVRGGLLCSSQAPEEASEVIELLREGVIKVLFVSPERFLNTEFLSIFSDSTPISLLVVDEAHCITEWSHNFRPSYMRLRASVLCSKLNIKCILAMSATVTPTTLNSVMRALDIPSSNLIQKSKLRNNLQLSVSRSVDSLKDLIKLMKMSPFNEVESIIVYCKFQIEADTISKRLCDYNISSMSYHSGKPTKERSRVQHLFCSNKIRVVVATVAFGMGLNKTDVGAVIHFNQPESVEAYAQEIGRAGRDGRLSYCHLFFDDVTYYKLRSLMHSDGVDEYAVNKFLSHVFCSNMVPHGMICSLIIESASQKFDMKEEVMITLLTQLELGDVQYLRLLPQLNVNCILNFYKSSPSLLAANDIIVSAILEKSVIKQGQHAFDIPAVVNSIGITPADLLNHLQDLKSKGEITYELKDAAFCYSVVKVPEDLCSLTEHLTSWLADIERFKIRKLDAMYNAAVAAEESNKREDCSEPQHTPGLQKIISDYFMENSGCDHQESKDSKKREFPFLRADIKVFLQKNSHAKFTPRAIARILHGIGSPAYLSRTWSSSYFWGLYTKIDFDAIMEAAKAELMNRVGNNATKM